MDIDVILTEDMFRRFTLFDLLRHRRQWRSPAIFAAILCPCACVCFVMHHVRGAVLLGCTLLLVGLGLPAVYFATFARSLKQQIQTSGLQQPRRVYSLHLTKQDDGIAIRNDTEQTTYRWNQVCRLYRDKHAVYLYMTPTRAFLLPDACVKGSPDQLWSLLTKMVPASRIRDYRR